MSEEDAPPVAGSSEQDSGDGRERLIVLPRWVPPAIGLVLVLIAALAVYTGLQARKRPLTTGLEGTGQVAPVAGPESGAPGAPGPGATRFGAGAPVEQRPAEDGQQQSRVVIRGGPGGVVPSIRTSVRRGVIMHVQPPDALMYVNGDLVGTVASFGSDEVFEFPAEGDYTIRLAADDHAEWEYVVTASASAKQEVATLEVDLARRE
ncbi:MAG TPA: hypothetical protein VM534_09860 [Thermoanaerobaculia bacterium]|nr:hypothetical protein [Thermoanaerobaculia bacterium]